MAGIDFRSLFTTQPQRQLVSGLGATSEWRIKPTTFSEDDQDPRFPAFQQAWKQGAGLTDLFGSNPFELHGSVAPSGGDNHRPDVAKVQTLLGNAGYVGIRDGGPNGYPSEMLDSAIRQFQQDKGLKVDGVLKPGGPTITALGSLLGGSAQPPAKPAPQKGLFGEFNGGTNSIAEGEWDWMDKDKRAPDWRPRPEVPVPVPQLGGLGIPGDLLGILTGEKPFPTSWPQPTDTPTSKPHVQQQPQGQPRLVKGGRIVYGEIPNDPNDYEWFLEYPDGTRVVTDPPPREPVGRAKPIDPYPDHTISQDGAFEHDKYAENLVRDSNPHETARYLKNVISWNGDTGRGDVADLLGRFAKVDEAKAKVLQDALHQASGERIPFRVAPLAKDVGGPMADLAEGEAPQPARGNPFGPAEGADRWEAGNMARALLGKSDYQDAVTHFKGEVAKDRAAAMPYLAAVHEEMAAKNPEMANKFAGQMERAGMAQAAETNSGQVPEGTVGGSGTKDDPWVSEGGTEVWRDSDGAWHVGDVRPSGSEVDDGTSIGVEAPSAPKKPALDPRYGNDKTPPPWKKDVLDRQPGAWGGFNGSVSKLPGATDTEKFVYGQIFAAEGGNEVDKKSGASSGITKDILAEAKASGKIPGLDKVISPKDLNADQRAAIMQSYFDQRFRHVGGAKMLDWVGDKVAAGALADTVFRLGASGGMKMIQQAINQLSGRAVVDEDGGMGPKTFNEFQRLVNDPKTRDQLLNKIADLRNEELQGAEKDRTDHYRPR